MNKETNTTLAEQAIIVINVNNVCLIGPHQGCRISLFILTFILLPLLLLNDKIDANLPSEKRL